MASSLRLRLCSSLDKVFAEMDPPELPEASRVTGTALQNERFSFQVAWYWDAFMRDGITVSVQSAIAGSMHLYQVGLVPCELPNWPEHDDDVLRVNPGLFPDPLLPLTPGGLRLLPRQWRSVWVEVDGTSCAIPAGAHDITLIFSDDRSEEELGRATFRLDVLPASLPPQTLIHTQWFHTDCLATHYGDPVFSEAHWTRVAQYVGVAVAHGIDMLLTPLFTPPLDTAVGGERPTVQLVDVWMEAVRQGEVTKEDEASKHHSGPADVKQVSYRFGFDRLLRWLRMGDRLGVRYFELSHLFTQWGAEHAPKIMAYTRENPDGERIFGWETDASGPEYVAFLDAFLPALQAFLTEHGYAERVWFHVSDEPSLSQLTSYRAAASVVRRHAGNAPVLDALSDYSFYEHGLVTNPVPANNHIQPFLDGGVQGLWTYYCCAQHHRVSNRFFSMPAARNRILGLQLFKFDLRGFLHWGYNFWNTQYSRRPVDPFRETDAGGAFPGGDAFLVYPGMEGPIGSMRLKVTAEAMQDLRALQALAVRIGRVETLRLMEEGLEAPITFDEYPQDADWLLKTRARVNRALADLG